MACKNAKLDAEKLAELKYEDLRECNCERCEPLADKKELDNLRTFRQESEIKEEAQKQAKELAAEIIATGKQVDGELKGMMKEIVEKELENAGIEMKGTLGRVIEKKMQFDLSSAPSVNTRYGRDQLSPQMKAFVHWARTGEILERKVLAENTPSAGGYLVPEEFRAEVIRKLQSLSAIRRSGARAFTVSSDTIRIPTVEANGSGAWTGENQLYMEDDPAFGEITLNPHKYTRLVRASDEMLADSGLNVADLLTDIFAEDFSSAEDEAFWVGSGVNQPTGILTEPNVDSIAAGASLSDDLINLVYALPRAYRQGAVFYMSSANIQALRLLKSENGNYIWSDGIQNGEPPRLLGYPVFEVAGQEPYDIDGEDVGSALGTDIVFGNPRYYYIADRQGMRVERSTERYFEYGQVAFRADMRVDGEVALTEAFKKLVGVPV